MLQRNDKRGQSMTTNPEREPFVDAVEAGEFLHLRPRRVLELARLYAHSVSEDRMAAQGEMLEAILQSRRIMG